MGNGMDVMLAEIDSGACYRFFLWNWMKKLSTLVRCQNRKEDEYRHEDYHTWAKL